MLECARLCQTSLIVIDDIHLLELRREADRDANNHLKRLANDLQATFVYAGVGLSHGGFMHEGLYGPDAALAQISQRFKRLPVEPLRRSTQPERAMWLGVLSVFERELVLLGAKAGDLTGQADYLWRRTQGVIGSLTQLLTEATAEAIDTGAERITRKLLDDIDIGYAAEVGAGRQQPRTSGGVRTLPLRLSPIDGESLPGYVARYAHTFQFPPGDLVRALGLDRGRAESRQPAATASGSPLSSSSAPRSRPGSTTARLERMLLARYAGLAFDPSPLGARSLSRRGASARGADLVLAVLSALPARRRRVAAVLAAWLERRLHPPPGAPRPPLPEMRQACQRSARAEGGSRTTAGC